MLIPRLDLATTHMRREEREEELASLPGFQLLPLSRFEQWGPHITKLLDPSRKTICLCHHGVRSMQVCGKPLTPAPAWGIVKHHQHCCWCHALCIARAGFGCHVPGCCPDACAAPPTIPPPWSPADGQLPG